MPTTSTSHTLRPRFVRFHEALGRLSLSESTARRLEKDGKLPRRVFLSAQISGWYEDTLDAWEADKRAAAEAKKVEA